MRSKHLPAILRCLVAAAGLSCAALAVAQTGVAGGIQPYDNLRPSLGISHALATQGVFPSRGGSGSALGGMFAFVYPMATNFAPRGSLLTQGQTLAIAQNQALFALLGTNFGGNGVTTFQIPDLGGRLGVGAGTSTSGLSSYVVGQATGSATATLLQAQMPSHVHTRPLVGTTDVAGTSAAVGTPPPQLALTPLIAFRGVFPSRGGGGFGSAAFIGQVAWFAGNFEPDGWYVADGRLLTIQSNTALFSILGTQYGGNGITTFALPNLVSRAAIGADAQHPVGTTTNVETQSLSLGQMPPHTHTDPRGGSTGVAGLGQAFTHPWPTVALTFLVATAGIYSTTDSGGFDTDVPTLGQVVAFAGNFEPDGWAAADGRLLAIAENDALFSLMGTTFGGDGQNTFALPDLRGRAMMGTNFSNPVAIVRGSATANFTVANLPLHFHSTPATVPAAPVIGAATAGGAQARVAFTAPPSDGDSPVISYRATCAGAVAGFDGASSPIVVTGLAAGTPTTCTVTATNAVGTSAPSAASNAVTPLPGLAITFADPGPQGFGTTPTLAASTNAGLPVTFTSSTTGVCTVSTGGTLTFLAAGPCTINADAAGNADYGPAPRVTRSFTVNPIAPGAPTGAAAVAGNGSASVSFVAPVATGGAAITGYTVTASPGGRTASGPGTPIVVTGLANGTSYTFTVRAANPAGPGPASAASNAVTPTGADLALQSSVVPAAGLAGRDFVYTFTVTNAGNAPATEARIAVTLPAGRLLVWFTPGCAVAGPELVCAAGTLAPGAGATHKVVFRPLSAGASLGLTVAARLTGTDPDAANDTAAPSITVSASPAATAVLRYRLYSPVTREHHFTTDLNEYDTLGSYVGTWVQEGTVGKVLDNPGTYNGVDASPYYRVFNTASLQHLWTTEPNEYYTLLQFPQYAGEGVDGWIFTTQAPGTIPLYRLLYPFAVPVAGLHHWTIDPVEYTQLVTFYGWIGEGGSGYVIP